MERHKQSTLERCLVIHTYLLFRSMILFEIEKVKDVSMPRLEVDGKCPRALVSTLINVAGSVVEDPKHWHEAIGLPIGLRCVHSSGLL